MAILRNNIEILEEDVVPLMRSGRLREMFGISRWQARDYRIKGLKSQVSGERVYLEWAYSPYGRVTSIQAFHRFTRRLNMTAAELEADDGYQALLKKE